MKSIYVSENASESEFLPLVEDDERRRLDTDRATRLCEYMPLMLELRPTRGDGGGGVWNASGNEEAIVVVVFVVFIVEFVVVEVVVVGETKTAPGAFE
jgi:hypothetical protein